MHDRHASEQHSNVGDGPHAHIAPVALYLRVWGALLVLTVVTVAVAFVPLGPLNVPVAIAIATMKAALVALFFMHLYYDDRFNAVVFASGLLFLLIFGAFTLTDPLTRGLAAREERHDLAPSMMRPSARVPAAVYHDGVTSPARTATPAGEGH